LLPLFLRHTQNPRAEIIKKQKRLEMKLQGGSLIMQVLIYDNTSTWYRVSKRVPVQREQVLSNAWCTGLICLTERYCIELDSLKNRRMSLWLNKGEYNE